MFESLEFRRLLSTSDLFVTYTYFGDANLDGMVSGDDYSPIDFNIDPDGFYNGDFNYDGIIDADDYSIIDDHTKEFSGTAKDDVIIVSGNVGTGFKTVTITVIGRSTSTTFSNEIKIFANGGNDKVHIDLPAEFSDYLITIFGGAGDDTITGSAAAERIIAGDGNDVVNGNDGRDTIYGEGGDDSVRGGGGSDLLDGGEGNDTLRGDAGNDNISGGAGFDRLRGSAGNDSLAGGSSKDFIGGEAGDDHLSGGGGGDVLSGGDGNDRLDGDAGDDHLDGNDGEDTLVGGSGDNVIFGGAGNDDFPLPLIESQVKDLDDEDRNDSTGTGGVTKVGSGSLTLTGSNSFYSGVQGEVQRAYTGGSWDQPGLTTSIPDASTGLTTIGVATGQQVRGIGPTDTDVFAGQTITGASTIAMYTYAGDANLDGFISGDDYSAIDFSVVVPGAAGWFSGDFNYDGRIDADDYAIIDFQVAVQNLAKAAEAAAADDGK